MSVARADICHRAIVAQIKIDDVALSDAAHALLLYVEAYYHAVDLKSLSKSDKKQYMFMYSKPRSMYIIDVNLLL